MTREEKIERILFLVEWLSILPEQVEEIIEKVKGSDTMKEHIDLLAHLAEVLYSKTKGKYTISKTTAATWQLIIDDMQEQLDEIVNELTRPE